MWKKIKFKQMALSLLLVLGFLLGGISPLGASAEGGTEGRDMSALLKEKNPTINIITKQGDKELNTDDYIDYTEPVKITAKDIVIPLKGDAGGASITEDKYIKAGDKASFVLGKVKLPNGATISGAETDIKSDDGTVIGKFIIKSNSLPNNEKEVIAELSFARDKENEFLNQWKNMKISVWAEFELKNMQNPPKPGDPEQNITIFDKTFKLREEKLKAEMTKSGLVDYNKAQINWTVTIEGKGLKSGQSLGSLAGYKFVDDFHDMGHRDANNHVENPYVAGSFKIKNKDGSLLYSGAPNILNRNHEADSTGTVISYVIPAGASDTVIVEFTTQLKPWDLVNGATKTNTAELFDKIFNKEKVGEASATVDVVADWGAKTIIKQLDEKNYSEDSNYYYVDWEVVFKGGKKGLKNVVIEDVPPYDIYGQSRLEFVSAKLSKGNSATDSWNVLREYGDGKPFAMPSDHKYKLSDFGIQELNDDIKLEVKSRISKADAPVLMTFKNSVNITFGDNQVLNGVLWKQVDLGPLHSILKNVKNGKKVTVNNEVRDYIGYETTWEVGIENDVITPGQTYVYDPVIYDAKIGTSSDTTKFKVFKNGTEATLPLQPGKTLADILKGSIANIKHNVYVDGSFEAGTFNGNQHNMELTAYELRYENRPVGHLLAIKLNEQVKNANGLVKVFEDGSDWKKYRQTFTFKTKITNSFMLVQSPDSRNTNIAALVRTVRDIHGVDKQWITYAGAWPYYKSRMFKKQVLTNEAAKKLSVSKEAANVNTDNIATATDSNGALKDSYNKTDRTILYRLSVNAEGVRDVDDYIEKVSLQDVMPKGWKFDKIDAEDFLIYKGKTLHDGNTDVDFAGNEAFVEAVGNPLPKSEWEHFLSFEIQDTSDDTRAIFKFNKLKGPYVILLKAKLTDEGLSGSNGKLLNKDGNVTNHASLYMGQMHKDDSKKVAYDTKFLTKISDENVVNGEAKTLTWKIGYTPYNLPKATQDTISVPGANVELVDVLGKGMEIKKDAEGNLSFDRGYYVLTEKWIESGEVKEKTYTDNELKAENVVTYDKTTRELKVKLKNPMHEYNFSYVTTITAHQGEVISNTVKIVVNGQTKHEEVKQMYTVKHSGGSVNWDNIQKTDVHIYKVGSQGASIAGAEFELTRPDNPQFKQKSVTQTPDDGKLTFKDLLPGTYTLKETKAPDGYIKNDKTYTFVVKKNEDGFIVSFVDIKGELEKVDDVLGLKVYNYRTDEKTDLEIFKTDKADRTKFLKGAEFKLTLKGKAGNSDVLIASGVATNAEGKLAFKNLVAGSYILEETKAPAGYKVVSGAGFKFEFVVTPGAVNAADKLALITTDENKAKISISGGAIVVVNEKETVPNPNPNPNPNPDPGPVIPPTPGPNPDPNPNPNTPVPGGELPRYPENNFPDPNDPNSPDELISVDENGTPQGKYVKSEKPDGEKEYIKVDEDETPQGVKPEKNKLPNTGGTNTTVYYAGGVLLLLLAAGVVVIRRRKYNN